MADEKKPLSLPSRLETWWNIRDSGIVSGSTALVLYSLASRAEWRRSGFTCFPSNTLIARDACITTRSVSKALTELTKKKVIDSFMVENTRWFAVDAFLLRSMAEAARANRASETQGQETVRMPNVSPEYLADWDCIFDAETKGTEPAGAPEEDANY